MNCEKCQELLSDFIDDELEEQVSAAVETHLELCFECAELHEDFAGILIGCEKKGVTEEIAPPNPQAMWCRINNVIEAEIKPEILKEKERKGWFANGKIWSFSFSQIAASIVGIAVISSLLTFVGLKNDSAPIEISSNPAPPSLFQRALSKVGLADTPQQAREKRIREQQIAIDYWNKRVEARRVQWDKSLQAAFDRNLTEINQVVTEYTLILEENPQDELSSEMLDSALNDKVDLLREFSDL
jgi:hypothetical protein